MAHRTKKLFFWTAYLPFGSPYKKRRLQSISVQRLRLSSPVKNTTANQASHKSALSPSEINIPFSETPIVSIIISTYGQVKFTLLCLQSIMESNPEVELEVIVIDDAYPGPEDLTPLRDVKNITFIRNKKNLGFVLSNNNAVPLARGKYLHFLNNDTEVLPGAIDHLVQTLQTHEDIGLVGSKLIFSDGSLQEAGGIIWRDGSGWNFGRGGDPSRPEFNYSREVDYCSVASIAISKDLFQSLGLFNPIYAPAYYEDTDLAMRVRKKGLRVLYVPDSVVIHHEGKSHGTDVKRGVKAYQVTNRVKFCEVWKEVLTKNHFSGPEDWTRARDHGPQRKVILIIDRYAPEPDQDAGSHTMMTIIECFVQAGWIVKFWSYEQIYNPVYTKPLEKMGVEVLDQRWPGRLSTWLQENGANLDHVLISRPTIAKATLKIVKKYTNAIISFYGHDLHFSRLRRQAMHASSAKKFSNFLSKSSKFEKMERQVWNQANLVLYLSENETNCVKEISPWVRARTINLFSFPIARPRTAPPSEYLLLFVAGFAHAPNIDAAQFLVHDILPKLEKKVGPVRIVLAGANPAEAVKALAGPRVDVTGYVSEDALFSLYQKARVAIVPLRFGAGVKGKIVEALSYGLPLVSTDIGAQGIPDIEKIIPIHNKAESIASSISVLLLDEEAWLKQSREQLEFAQSRFSFPSIQKSLLEAVENAKKDSAFVSTSV